METPDTGGEWGILGGTFDPVHLGHIRLATDIKIKKKLDGIILIPSFLHPFKKETTFASFEDRVEMLRLATKGIAYFYISTLEKEFQLSGYTIDTVKAVKRKYPQTMFYFIIGADNISQISMWHQPEKIMDEIKIIAGRRPNYTMTSLSDRFNSAIEYIDTSELDIASTDIRKFLTKRDYDRVAPYLAPEVLDYIQERKLYI